MDSQFQMLFEKMKIEMQNQTAELKESITKSIMDTMDEKLSPIIEENKKLKSEVEKLQKEIEHLRRGERSNNIMIFGLEELETSTGKLLNKMKGIFKNDLNITLEDNEINKIHRIGNKNNERNKPRPILCSFVTNWKKNEIMKNKKSLSKIYITEDYSKEVLEKRRALKTELDKERQKGNVAYLKHDKLIVKENYSSHEKRKRDVSASPSSSSSYQMQPRKQQTISSIK
ncbi:uncharacterized protein LOC111352198 [Spodoptera litura]|uniref:Uncharacterized protein LOC111352198 n=1 Tax=Spodoptera litura TaxID=69820 RepID=A0A9J7DZQ7_SPOLT|nr:uncharacterized protein LOC111352198 [Spodoptera litura]